MVTAPDKKPADHIALNPTLHQKLAGFVLQHQTAFQRHWIPQHFLTKSPDTWGSDNDYIVGQWKVRSVKVVSNAAERGVKSGLYSGVQRSYKKSRETDAVPTAS